MDGDDGRGLDDPGMEGDTEGPGRPIEIAGGGPFRVAVGVRSVDCCDSGAGDVMGEEEVWLRVLVRVCKGRGAEDSIVKRPLVVVVVAVVEEVNVGAEAVDDFGVLPCILVADVLAELESNDR
ncbi:hypothetical protein BGX28_001903 [Mortierella sp. GBA30]|nr:hypothetical protein BGX28_001903 [Mortierella sp. GBA30]